MRNVYAFILVFLLVVPLPFFTLWINFEKNQVKKEVKEKLIHGIDTSKLERMHFTQKEIEDQLNWEHESEFELEGIMFDVVFRKKTETGFVFWCWRDQEETALNRHLKQLQELAWNKKMPQHDKHQLLSAFFPLYLMDESKSDEIYVEEKKHYFKYLFNLHNRALAPDTPPPNKI